MGLLINHNQPILLQRTFSTHICCALIRKVRNVHLLIISTFCPNRFPDYCGPNWFFSLESLRICCLVFLLYNNGVQRIIILDVPIIKNLNLVLDWDTKISGIQCEGAKTRWPRSDSWITGVLPSRCSIILLVCRLYQWIIRKWFYNEAFDIWQSSLQAKGLAEMVSIKWLLWFNWLWPGWVDGWLMASNRQPTTNEGGKGQLT